MTYALNGLVGVLVEGENMKSNVLGRTLAGAVAVVAITGLGLAGGAGTGFAANHQPAANATVTPLAIVNLGLSTSDAVLVQHYLATYWSYTGGYDGQLGPQSWEAMQRYLKADYGYTGAIDGIVGSGTISSLQVMLETWGYSGAIDGIAGPATEAAFRNFAEGKCSQEVCN